MNSTPQVDKSHYRFEKYAFEGRFVSYYWQLREALASNPSSILEVGVGERVFGNYIKENTGAPYTSVDIAPDLAPDRVASVLQLPFPDKSFDVVCAFEVLEHLPFEDFEKAVSELCRVAKKRVCISLPHFGPMVSFFLKVPFLPKIRFAMKIPFPQKHAFNGEHYWEIGKRGFPPSRIRTILGRYGDIVVDRIPFNSDYHHFFTLELQK